MTLVLPDRVKETTNTTGTGSPLSLQGVVSADFQTFVAGVGAGNETDYVILDGNAWEIARGTVSASPDQITRTFIGSSTGSALNLSGSATVFAGPTGNLMSNALLPWLATSTASSITGTVNRTQPVDISGYSADGTFTLPSSCKVGDIVEVRLVAGNGSYALAIRNAGSQTIDGVDYSSADFTRLFTAKEWLQFRCTTANTAWSLLRHGKTPCSAYASLSTAETTNSAGTWTSFVNSAGVFTEQFDIGNCFASGAFTARRAGKIRTSVTAHPNTNVTGSNYYGVRIAVGSVTWSRSVMLADATTGLCYGSTSAVVKVSAGDVINPQFISQESNRGATGSDRACCVSFDEVFSE